MNTPKKIKAIKIDAMRQRIIEVVIEGSKLADYYTHIGCDCMDRVVPRGLMGNDCVFVDDEGLINDKHKTPTGLKVGFRITGYPGALVGNGLIVGADDEGEAISAETPLALIAPLVSFGAFVPVSS